MLMLARNLHSLSALMAGMTKPPLPPLCKDGCVAALDHSAGCAAVTVSLVTRTHNRTVERTARV